jgi:hypothetical protein
MDLSKSIGKLKGNFIPVVTKFFDDSDDDL